MWVIVIFSQQRLITMHSDSPWDKCRVFLSRTKPVQHKFYLSAGTFSSGAHEIWLWIVCSYMEIFWHWSVTPRRISIHKFGLKQALQETLPVLILSHNWFLRWLKEVMILLWETEDISAFLISLANHLAGISEIFQHREAIRNFWGMTVYTV